MAASVVPTGSMFLYVVQIVTREMSKLLGVLGWKRWTAVYIGRPGPAKCLDHQVTATSVG